MAEAPVDNDALETDGYEGDASDMPWSQLWHGPVLLLGLAVFMLGLYLVWPTEKQFEYHKHLRATEEYLAVGNFDDAKARLDLIGKHLDEATSEVKAKWTMFEADLVYLQQAAIDGDVEQNHRMIVAGYQKAQEGGATLGDVRLKRWAESLVALGEEQQALDLVSGMDDQGRRCEVLREIIERRAAIPASRNGEQLFPLITRYLEEVRTIPDIKRRQQERIWALALRGELMIEAGRVDRAISDLMLQIQRLRSELTGEGEEQLAPLLLLLAKAYHKQGDAEEAKRYYELTQRRLGPSDALNADVLVGLGQLQLASNGSAEHALEMFSHATRNYPSSRAYLPALIGQADCEARLDAHAQALDHFRQAVDKLVDQTHPPPGLIEHLTNTAVAHFERHRDRAEYDRALDYLSLLPPLYADGMPARLVLGFAATHEQIAQQRMTDGAAVAEDGAERGMSPAEIRAARAQMFQEAAIHFEQAGRYYLDHARLVRITDDDAHGHSLWRSAVCFDRAQLWDQAIKVYGEFVETRGTDARHLKAIYRLGLAYLADGQYEAAAERFRELREENPTAQVSYASIVPLARCYVQLDRPDDAERLLRYVLTDDRYPAQTPESTEYREALVELGKLYYRQGKFKEAVEQFELAVDRYAHSMEGTTLRYYLADAYRLSTRELDEELKQQLPPSMRLKLRAERTRRLQRGLDEYSKVVDQFEARRDLLNPTERMLLRNAYFYRGDCAYDMGKFREAIRLYDLAVSPYVDHPASLVALVQIVNANCELGQFQDAKVANLRAQEQLKRMPPDVFEDPTLPMTRQHWQDWLRWTSELDLFGSQANAGAEPR